MVQKPAPCTPSGDPGRVLLHRINRREYNNAVRDLFGLSSRPADAFPKDNTATYFDNDSGLLGITAEQLSIYFQAATAVASEAMLRSKARIVTCAPGTNAEPCARQIIAQQGRRIFRRALSAEDVDFVWTSVMKPALTVEHDTFDAAVTLALRFFLTSPRFLYRFELHSSPDDKTAIEALDGPELATRLSFFLWSSVPDDALLDLAEQLDPLTGRSKLEDPGVLEAQVDRMLLDPKARVLSETFGAQWLGLDQLDVVAKSPTLFPGFDDALRADLKTETKLLFAEVFGARRPITELLTARYGFINERVATHYGLTGVAGPDFRKVALGAETKRAGYLSQGSFLANASEIGRTSIVKRGEYVLDRLLCAQPAEPPANVPPLPESGNGPPKTLRQRVEEHRSQPACNGCHSRMDPIGFGLENFDAVGRWRDTDEGFTIDASGRFPDGRTFSGAVELADLIAADPKFEVCVTKHLTAWALGRSATAADQCAIEQLADSVRGQSSRDLVQAIVKSDAFLKSRGEEVQP